MKIPATTYAAAQYTEATYETVGDAHEPPPSTDPPEGKVLEDLSKMPYTDLGNAKRLHRQFGRDLRWCAARGGWYLWTGTHWTWDDQEGALRKAQLTAEYIRCEAQHWERLAKAATEGSKEAKDYSKNAEAARSWCHKSQASERINAILKQAKALPGMAVTMEQFDRDPWLLNVENGTLELKTCTFRAHRRKDLIDRVAPVKYDTTATCPTWDTFISEVFPDSGVRTFVQRALGYSFTGDVSEQVWFLMKGKGSNGKSTILDLVKAMLGPYATTLILGFLEAKEHEPHPTELASMYRARFASGSEPRPGRHWDDDKIKNQTGDARMKARYCYQDEFEFDITHKLWVAANKLPPSKDNTAAFWRRVKVIPFTQRWYRPEDLVGIKDTSKLPKVDPKLPEKLEKELSGILNWVLEGVKAWVAGGLAVPEACLLATKEYREEQDEIAKFLADRCMVGDGFSVTTEDLHRSYLDWREEQEIETDSFNKPKFGKALTDAGFVSFPGRNKAATRRGLRLLTEQELKLRAAEAAKAAAAGDPDDSLPDAFS